MKPAAPGTWKCDCGAANAERYQNCWRCRRRKPRREGHHPHLAARHGTALKGLRGPMPGAPYARIFLTVLFQPLRMLSDKPPQTTSTGRSVAMSGRPRDIRTTCSKSHRPVSRA